MRCHAVWYYGGARGGGAGADKTPRAGSQDESRRRRAGDRTDREEDERIPDLSVRQVQVVSERRKPRHEAATHDPEGEEGDRYGTPLPPDQAIGVNWKVAFSPSVRGSSGFDGLTHEPYVLRQSCETPRNSVGWQKRLTSIQLGRLTVRRTWFALRKLRPIGFRQPGRFSGESLLR